MAENQQHDVELEDKQILLEGGYLKNGHINYAQNSLKM